MGVRKKKDELDSAVLKRNNKFWGVRATPELNGVLFDTTKVLNEVSSKIRRLIKDGSIVRFGKYKVVLSPSYMRMVAPVLGEGNPKSRADNIITDTELKELMRPIFDAAGCVQGNENYKRSQVWYIAERYSGYANRGSGKNKVPNIRIHGKNLYFKDNGVVLNRKKMTLTVKTLFGEKEFRYNKRSKEYKQPFVRVGVNKVKTDVRLMEGKEKQYASFLIVVGEEEFKIEDVDFKNGIMTLDGDPPRGGLLSVDRVKFGGNLKYHKKTKTYSMIVAVDCRVDSKYVPLGVLSFDMNKTPEYWLSFNDKSVISMDERTQKLVGVLRFLNKILALKNKPVSERFIEDKEDVLLVGRILKLKEIPSRVVLDSRLRSRIRRVQIETHRRLKVICEGYARVIVDKAAGLGYLLAIDSVRSGDKMGTFGQDHLIPALQRMCENEGVPFYVIPCAYTSRRCSSCGYTSKENRKEDDFECIKCGHKEISHLNAAKNIAQVAKDYLSEKRRYANYS